MSKNRVGGHKRKAWRLKKKYDKWFIKLLREFIDITLKEMPNKLLDGAFSLQSYDFMRLYK